MLERLEVWIKERLRKALAIPPLEQRVTNLETLTQQLQQEIGEIKVQLEAKDFFAKSYWDVGIPVIEARIQQMNREISEVKSTLNIDSK